MKFRKIFNMKIFPISFSKYFRTTFLQNTSRRLLLIGPEFHEIPNTFLLSTNRIQYNGKPKCLKNIYGNPEKRTRCSKKCIIFCLHKSKLSKTVFSYHVTYTFQSEFTFYSYLNAKEINVQISKIE